MPSSLDDFGGEILRSSTESIGHLITRDLELAETEIGQLDMPIGVKDNIFWLQIPVDYPIAVQALKSQNYLSCIEARSLLMKLCLFAQVEEKFSTIQKIDDEIETLWRLKRVVQLDNERVIYSLQDHALNYCTAKTINSKVR